MKHVWAWSVLLWHASGCTHLETYWEVLTSLSMPSLLARKTKSFPAVSLLLLASLRIGFVVEFKFWLRWLKFLCSLYKWDNRQYCSWLKIVGMLLLLSDLKKKKKKICRTSKISLTCIIKKIIMFSRVVSLVESCVQIATPSTFWAQSKAITSQSIILGSRWILLHYGPLRKGPQIKPDSSELVSTSSGGRF